MDQEVAQLRVFERLRTATAWLRVPPDIFDDVVQEAWLLTLDYAAKSGKSLDDLSNTEFRFRCLEATRKIRSPYQERFLGEDVIELAAEKLPITEEIVDAEIKTSDSSEGRLSRLMWLLEVHPVLKLTDHQRTLWDLMRRKDKHGWQVDYARGHLITRQAVNKTAATIRKKVTRAADLVRLAEGELDYFFDRYGKEWNPWSLRSILTELFRPRLGIQVPPELIRLFLPLQKSILEQAVRILEEETRQVKAGNVPRPEKVALGTNLFYLADHMADYLKNSSLIKSVSEEMYRKAINLGPFFDIAFKFHSYLHGSGNWVGKYIEWFNERFQVSDQSGRDYANYHLAYYHAIPPVKKVEFLKSAGTAMPEEFSYPEIISCTYINTRNSFYVRNPSLLDVNFLRFMLIKKHFPLDQRLLPLSTQYALKTLAEKALHSREPLVIQGAEEILAASGI